MLTKSDLFLYRDVPLHLWAMKNDRIINRPATAYQEFLRRQAAAIETLAGNFIAAINPPPAVVYSQAPFTSGPFHARTDFLVGRPDGLYDLYEVKSSTRVKPEHVIDAAFQALVVGDHHPLGRIFITHINSDYTKYGNVDPLHLFVQEDVSEQVFGQLSQVDALRRDALQTSLLPADQVFDEVTRFPLIQGCSQPATCICPDLCFPQLPEYPIYQLPLLGKKAAGLAAQGIFNLADIPADYRLSDIQRRHVLAAAGEPQIDLPAIRRFLSELTYPLFFLDYETCPAGIPIFDGYRPYDHVVFQFSVHIQDSPGADPRALDYLHTEATDPAPHLAAALAQVIGPQGSIIVWNQSFEKGRNSDLAARLPSMAKFFSDLNDRLVDLMDVFKKGMYVHRDFKGSASLKRVLPVFIPDLEYERMAITQGDEAMLAWQILAFDPLNDEQRNEISENLLNYCRTDTIAMVRILEKLAALL